MGYVKNLSLIAIIFLGTACIQIKEPRNGSTTQGGTITLPPQQGGIIQSPPYQGGVIIQEPQPPIPQGPPIPVAPVPNVFSMHSLTSPYLQGSYRSNYKLKNFINKMINEHGFRRDYLNGVFSSVRRDTEALKKIGAFNISKPSSGAKKTASPGSWDKYRGNFLTSSRIEKGVKFWKENEYYLNRAAEKYGVAPAYIVGIIGVETNFGGYTGKHNVLNALTSISLEFPKRSKFFTMQLEHYLLMTRKERIDPRTIEGSYAGAFGLSQFMPDSFMDYAVDHDGNGQINLFTKADAIGSVANFFKVKGKWDENIPVAMPTNYSKNRFYGLKTGFRTRYSQ
ncbi:MAG: lytic murein transglycosylase, partial [Sulfurovaceae bacterium]|nr:lytic murein transglycosylase [Sulfurovaceae bacterium]